MSPRGYEYLTRPRMRNRPIVRVTAKLVIPPILLFAFYVQFHGDFGPGGGFQAGVILAAGIILYALVFGLDSAKRAVMYADLQAIVHNNGGVVVLMFAIYVWARSNKLMHGPKMSPTCGISRDRPMSTASYSASSTPCRTAWHSEAITTGGCS